MAKRIAIALAVAGLIAGQLAPTALAREPSGSLTGLSLTPTSVYNADKSLSGRLAQSDADLLNRRDAAVVQVMVKLDVDAVASYQGGISGLKATSPGVTGVSLDANRDAVNAYKDYLTLKTNLVRRAAKEAVPGLTLGRDFLIVYGGFSASLPANKAKLLARVPGVAAVQYDSVQHPTVNYGYSQHFVGADAVWPSVGGSILAGAGVKVGVLDTGIWPEHPMLADLGLPAMPGSYGCEFDLSTNPDDPSFACNDKMLGAYAFMDTNMFVNGLGADEYCDPTNTTAPHIFGTCSARDADGHGTHTATTAVGDGVASAVLLGVERGPLSGIAPGASLIAYRVCGASTGCYSSDSASAVAQAILDDVDVINFSISGGADPYSDPVELAFLDAYAAGIEVNASAGNAGPGASTSDHGGPWTNTVGASTWNKAFDSTLHLAATGGSAPLTLNIVGVTVTDGVTSPTPVVLASDAPYSDDKCTTDPGSAIWTGMVVVCKRGTNARIDKGYNASLGDAAGMILYNQSAAVTDIETDNHFLPAIHVNFNSDAVASFVSSHTGVTAWWTSGVLTAAQGDVMASFSSRGPLGDFIKPDVTAPGVQILAGNSPKHIFAPEDGLGPNDELYQAIAGTSMSSPHAAGVAALIKAAHPSWTPGMIKSAMMTSAMRDVFKEDGVTPADPFDDGAGSIRANRAVNPTVTFDVTASDYYNTAYNQSTAVVLDRINLNLPSINAPIMPGRITATRTARNSSGHTIVLDLSTVSPPGASITVAPKVLTIPPNQSRSFTVTIDGTSLAEGWYFGSVKLDSRTAGDLDAVLPVAFNKTQGDVSFDNSCESASVAKGDEIACEVTATNQAPQFADLSMQVRSKNSRVQVNDWVVSDQGDPGRPQANQRRNGFLWNGYLTPALPPAILGLDSPAGGFLDLPAFGVTPEDPLWGDETIVNYDFSPFGVAFKFGDVTYDSIGIVSDGYVVMGGGVSQDVNYIPQDMPDTSPPNNVLAPYWTDLNFADGGDVYIAFDDDGTWYTFMIIQFDAVPIYGTCATTCKTRSFQIWVATDYWADTYNGGQGFIEFDYNAADIGPGSADGLNVGAEDALGLTAAQTGVDNTQTFVPNTSGYVVDVGTATPGGTVTIDYDVKGQTVGSASLISRMWSDIVAGQTRVLTPLTVTP